MKSPERRSRRMHLRTIDGGVDTADARDELAAARLCAAVNRAYSRRLTERGLITEVNEGEPSADDLNQIESEES